jgi:hypothetical protein
VKLDYVGRIGAIEIVTSEPERWRRIRALLWRLREQFGGPIVVFERAPAQ